MNLKIDLTNNPSPHNQSGTNRWGGVYKSKRELAYIKELTEHLTPLTTEQYTDTPLQVSYTFYIKPPKSWTKGKTQQALTNKIHPTAHNVGDVDNLVKSTQDVLMATGIVDDDSNVVTLTATKMYAETPAVTIEVTPWHV